MFAINRELDVPSFTHSVDDDGTLTISTSSVKLSFKDSGDGFSEENLSVVSLLGGDSAFEEWHYGKPDVGNLLGTIRTLDSERFPPLNCTVLQANQENQCGWDGSDCACEWAPISKDGWAVVDDSQNYALSSESDFWDGPNQDAVDLYLFAHGRDYRAALGDFVAIGGRIAMSPRSAVGPWWTRWYDFTQGTAISSVEDFKTRGLPLDILVLDMNWHTKNDWTGYTFDKRLYPFPGDMLETLQSEFGLSVAMNLHDADGVGSFEDEFENMCAALGLDPEATDVVAYNVSDEAAQNALEDVVLLPLEDMGVGFWWIDWQQGESGYGAAGGKMNPTIWTAHQRSTDHARRNLADSSTAVKRGMVLARWGGLGGHRYQVGFSGDVEGADWGTLSFQPYFSATAANVGFGLWSHDIVGAGRPEDPELYVRWLQWGAYSGVLRMHDRGASAGSCADNGDGCMLDKPWEDGVGREDFVHMRSAIRERSTLLPYLYTAMRGAFEDGVSILHPLYYEWPEEAMAYMQSLALTEYALGPDLMVAPVVAPSDNITRLATVPLWVPPGRWVEQATGRLRTSSSSSSFSPSTSKQEGTKTPSSLAAGPFNGDSPTCAASSVAGVAVECGPPLDEEGCVAKGCCWDGSADSGGESDDGSVDGGGGDLDGANAPKCFYPEQVMDALDTKVADLSEVPVLVRAGAVIPVLPSSALDANPLGLSSRPLTALGYRIYLSGATSGSGDLYEDDGVSTSYATTTTTTSSRSSGIGSGGDGGGDDDDGGEGAFRWTHTQWQYSSSSSASASSSARSGDTSAQLEISVGGASGPGYEGQVEARELEFRLVNCPPPLEVTLTRSQGEGGGGGEGVEIEVVPSRRDILRRRRHRFQRKRASSSSFGAASSSPVLLENDSTMTTTTTTSGFLSSSSSWLYEAKTATLVVSVGPSSTSKTLNVSVALACPSSLAASTTPFLKTKNKNSRVVFNPGVEPGGGCGVDHLLSGLSGLVWRAVAAKEALNEARVCPGEGTGETSVGATQELASLVHVLDHYANQGLAGEEEGKEEGGTGRKRSASDEFWDAVGAAPAMLSDALAELDGVNATALGPSQWRLERAKALLAEAANDLGA